MQNCLRVLFFAVLLAQVTSALAAVAYVHQVQGTLTAQNGGGPARTLKLGDLLDPGVTLSTGAKSTAVVKFEDGQIAVLEPDTRFTVRQYSYNKKQVRNSNILFQLLQGGLRFVTGVIGSTNHDSFKLTAGTSTIGVRGTDGTVLYDAISNIITAAVNVGTLALQAPTGTSTIPTGTFSSFTPGAPPSAPAPIAQATTAVAAQLALASSVAVPINTPIVVELSARAVVLQAAARAADAAAAAAPDNEAAQQAAREADAAAAEAVKIATQAAVEAFQAAVQAGAVPPAPPAPPTAGTDTQGQPTGQPPGTTAPVTPTPTPGGGGAASPS